MYLYLYEEQIIWYNNYGYKYAYNGWIWGYLTDTSFEKNKLTCNCSSDCIHGCGDKEIMVFKYDLYDSY